DTLQLLLDHSETIKKYLVDIQNKIQLLYGSKDEIMVKVPKERIDMIHSLCKSIQPIVTESTVHQLLEQCAILSWRPLGIMARKYQKLVSKTARMTNKTVSCMIDEEKQYFPADIFAGIDEVLIHLLRNCVSHGIESDQQRRELHKASGIIRLKVSIDEKYRHISISDDGSGIDTAAIVERAIAQKIITEQHASLLTEQEKIELIFQPGISTSKKITLISGRGVGMDIVRSTITRLQGTIKVSSERSVGTCFEMHLPLHTVSP
ncbi:MAG: hypothetical protein JW795_03190, partial [Chitinivibrionales bacterium]|nr:hypothetical protein [Chitinivibrionales bacterium]